MDMDQQFEKRVKAKQRRKIAIVVVLVAAVLAMVCIPWAMRAKKGKPITVSIEIRCDELAKNPSKLKKKNLLEYVPKDGVILAKETVQTTTKATVFDVLDEVCKKHDIQIEYSYTPAYDSYYVKGIHYLYEFDGGKLSGWTYSVNGVSPQYGCSKYQLKGDEQIVWNYTCGLSGGAKK